MSVPNLTVADDWQSKRLKYIASHNDEILPEDTDDFCELEYIEISSVSLTGGVEQTSKVEFHRAPSRARRKLQDGDILISTVRTYLKSIAAVPKAHENLIASTGFCVVRPKVGAHSGFLGWVAKSEPIVSEIVSRSVGVSYPAINAGELVKIEFPLPPLETQRRIARFLDGKTARIDGLIDRKRALLARLAEKRQVLITRAVTKGLNPATPMKDSGIDWLGDIPAHWEVIPLRRAIRKIEQGWSPSAEDRVKDDDEWGVLKSGCVNLGVFRPDLYKTLAPHLDPRPDLAVQNGDVLMCRASGSLHLIGSVAIAENTPENLIFSDKTYRISFYADNLLPGFFTHAMSAKYLREQIVLSVSGAGGLANNIGQASVKEYHFCFPTVEEQNAIVAQLDERLSQLNGLQDMIERSISNLTEYRAALITAVVTGKLAVPG